MSVAPRSAGASVASLITDHLTNPASTWSVGGYGAIAEFARDPDEPCELAMHQAVTARGAIRVERAAGLAARAYEVLSAQPALWHHGVLFSLPAATARMPARRAITELGPDHDAIRKADRAAALFDLGFGSRAFAFCVRTTERALIDLLRRAAGKSLFGAGREVARALMDASPHRVAISRVARIEVYQRIAAEGSATPSGPHTHVIPHLLRPGRAHSSSIPMPMGWIAGLTLYPPHPAKDEAGVPKPFAHDQHEAFQRLVELFGDDESRAAKEALFAAVERGTPPTLWRAPLTRHARTACRVALRQLRQSGATVPALEAWERAIARRGRA